MLMENDSFVLLQIYKIRRSMHNKNLYLFESLS